MAKKSVTEIETEISETPEAVIEVPSDTTDPVSVIVATPEAPKTALARPEVFREGRNVTRGHITYAF